MNRILKRFAQILLPLLIPVLKQLVETGCNEIKKKLVDNMKEESELIQMQLRSMSDNNRIS